MIPALQVQVNRDLYAHWRVTATVQWLPKGQAPPAGAWVLYVQDSSTVGDGVLGYHETLADGTPVAYVFAKDCARYNAPLSSVISHELLEMLVDPAGAMTAFVQDSSTAGRLIPYEVADPVESSLYAINGVQVSDFVTPFWFMANHPGGRVFDHLGILTNTLQLAKGGYYSYCAVTMNGGWTTIDAAGKVSASSDPDDKPLRIHMA